VVPTVTLRSLYRMSERVAQVQGCTHAAFALVRSHHLGLVYARPLDRIRQGLHGQETMRKQDQLHVAPAGQKEVSASVLSRSKGQHASGLHCSRPHHVGLPTGHEVENNPHIFFKFFMT